MCHPSKNGLCDVEQHFWLVGFRALTSGVPPGWVNAEFLPDPPFIGVRVRECLVVAILFAHVLGRWLEDDMCAQRGETVRFEGS